jgi:DNA-binding GntR family transcriptional regulator
MGDGHRTMRRSISEVETQMVGPVARRSLKSEAYNKIKSFLFADVTERVYSERQLASWLDVGLGSVRSAVERLRAEGLVTVLPNAGIRVPELTAHTIIDFYEVRSILESHVVASLAGRLTRAQIELVDGILARQQECVAAERPEGYHDLDMAFHITLTEFHGNMEIVRTLGQLRDKMYRLSRWVHQSRPERLAVNAQQHHAIWGAVCAGDGAKAMDLMQRHLRWGRNCTLDPTLRGARPGEGWAVLE